MADQFILVQQPKQRQHDTPIVFVHGSWGSSAMWKIYAQYFTEQGWNVYAPDLRGHGQSGGSVAGAMMEDYVADVRQAVQQHGLKEPIVIGHSMGGLVALLYAAEYGAHAMVAIDPSPTKEIQGSQEQEYPAEYSPMDAGMPSDPMEVMKALPDIPPEMLMKLKDMLGMESGRARSERKRGISVPKEKLPMPVLFVGGELGDSVPFGIGINTAQKMAGYYKKDVLEVKGATHPGILMGKHAKEAAAQIEQWLSKQ